MKLTRIFFKLDQTAVPQFQKHEKFALIREEEEDNCWRDLAPLEFEDWHELHTLCVNFAKKLSAFAHLEHLQLIILFGDVDDYEEEELVDLLVPVLGFIQVLRNRCSLFNLYTDNAILSLLYPNHTTPYLTVAHLGHQVYLPVKKLEEPHLQEFIREIDFLELCKLQHLAHFTNLLCAPLREGIYKTLEDDYYAVYRRNKQPCISLIPSNLFKIDNTPTPSQPTPTSASQPIQDHREPNKRQLKKLLLLSLRNCGIGQKHPEFKMIWKQLYCGCAFALRKDFPILSISQATMLQVINNNLKAFSIVTTP